MKMIQLVLVFFGLCAMSTAKGQGNCDLNDYSIQEVGVLFQGPTTWEYNLLGPANTILQWGTGGKGTILSTTSSSAVIRWDVGGAISLAVEFLDCDGDTLTVFFNKTLPATPPLAPDPPVVSASGCGSVTVVRGNPPADIKWYWQGTNPSGTLKTDDAISKIFTASGTYYIRAYDEVNDLWSTSSTAFTVTVIPLPGMPNAPTVLSSCGSATATRSNPPAGVTWYWQDNALGTDTGNSSQNIALPTHLTGYYLRARDNTTLCWGPARYFSYSTILKPAKPAVPLIDNDCGITTVTKGAAPSGVTWYWQTSVNGMSTSDGAASKTVTSTTTLYLRAKNSSANCWSDTRIIPVGVDFIGDLGDQNYVGNHTILVSGVLTESQIDPLSSDEQDVTVQYLDGLGRLKQTVALEASPLKNHLVQIIEYDDYGRQPVSYLPYTAVNNCEVYQPVELDHDAANYTSSPQYQFYQTAPKVAHDIAPYAQTVFEPSPLNRVDKQGAPGQAWQPVTGSATDKVQRMNYLANAFEEVRAYSVVPRDPVIVSLDGYYTPGELRKSLMADEDGNEVVEFTDPQGRMILKRVATGDTQYPWADTYYVYDNFENLSVVLPPEASKAIEAAGGDILPDGFIPVTQNLVLTDQNYTGDSYMVIGNATIELAPNLVLNPETEIISGNNDPVSLHHWAFRYEYDHRNRMIKKQVPGAGWVHMVYDDLDRLVLSQDANQRANHEWTFTKYDYLSRPVLTGIYDHGSAASQADMQNLVDTHYANTANKRFEESGNTVHGYTNKAFPNVANANDYLTVSYYDDYANLPAEFNFSYVQEIGNPAYNTEVIGQIVGGKTKLLDGSNTWLKSQVFYDDRYRVLQTHTDNHLGGSDRVSSQFDFPGRVLQTLTTHNDGSAATTINEQFTYDHGSRLMTATHKMNSQAAVVLVDNEYNELGELVDKRLHSADNGSTYEQSVDYRYNIRGWLQRINDAILSDNEGDYFGMELAYDQVLSGLSNTQRFNGNIAAIKWSNYSHGNGLQSAYNFSYDDMNRLTGSDYREKEGTADWVDPSTRFDVENLLYDLNGNIQSLRRFAENTGTAMDDMSYTYEGNRLHSVTDVGDTQQGFRDGNTTGNDYGYDENGNMILDKNKDILSISYNYLNLPQVVTFTNNRSIQYVYDAAGIKLQKIANDNGTLTTTDYVGGFIYEENVLQHLAHAEGRVRKKDNGDFVYDYYLKDHLDNTRLTFSADKPETVYRATMEGELATEEESYFLNLPSLREINVSANKTGSNGAVNGNEVVRLNGSHVNRRLGPGKMLQVMAGDQVDMEVYAYYTGSPGNNSPIADLAFAALIGNAFGGNSLGTEGEQALQQAFETNVAQVVPSSGSGSNTDIKAYLNYILFDTDFERVDAGYMRVDQGQVDGTHRLLQLNNIDIDQAGYLYVYTSNEGNVNFNVFFDELEIKHTSGGILQEDHYYPFGGSITALGASAPLTLPNRFKYNGFEEQTDFDLGWYDYQARFYDPQIGRFMRVDPAADLMRRHSPYNYAFDNPIRFIDPDGMMAEDVVEGEDSQEEGEDGDEECDPECIKKKLEEARKNGDLIEIYRASDNTGNSSSFETKRFMLETSLDQLKRDRRIQSELSLFFDKVAKAQAVGSFAFDVSSTNFQRNFPELSKLGTLGDILTIYSIFDKTYHGRTREENRNIFFTEAIKFGIGKLIGYARLGHLSLFFDIFKIVGEHKAADIALKQLIHARQVYALAIRDQYRYPRLSRLLKRRAIEEENKVWDYVRRKRRQRR